MMSRIEGDMALYLVMPPPYQKQEFRVGAAGAVLRFMLRQVCFQQAEQRPCAYQPGGIEFEADE